MNYPENQMEFEEMFKTEQDCIDYITLIKWPHGFECPICGSIRYWKKNKGRFECSDCHTETTVTNGIIFHESTKPLMIWFRAIWWMVAQKNGVSAKGLQKILGLGSYQTAWTCLHKFRLLMVLGGRNKLQGTVEVAVEINGRKTGRMRLAKIQDALRESLNEFIRNNIKISSKVVTDGWIGYNDLSQIGYTHEIQKTLVKDGGEEILPNVHRIASLLKRWLLGIHQSYLNKNKLEYYLDEYVFRYNRWTSTSRGLLFL